MNRSRVAVDLGSDWRAHIRPDELPAGATALGTVSVGGATGALVRLADGRYVQMVGGRRMRLDGRKVAAALGTAGRPVEVSRGRRVNVYLDAASIAAAAKLGGGSISRGIRRALGAVRQ